MTMAMPGLKSLAPASLSTKYRFSLTVALVLQTGASLLAAVTIDGGMSLRWVIFTMIAFWPAVLLIMHRRPLAPTKWDLIFVRSGCLLVGIAVLLMTTAIWALKAKLGFDFGLRFPLP
jgi:hypothetical protein